MTIGRVDAVGDQSTAPGTGSFVIDGVAVVGMVSFATGLTDGLTYRYRAQDATNAVWEVNDGVWTAGTSTLTRGTPTQSSNGGAKANFTDVCAVVVAMTAADFTDAVTGAALATLHHAASEKSALVDADEVTGGDSAAAFGLIRSTWTSIKAFLKTYFDTLYQPLAANLTAWAALATSAKQDALVSATNIKTINSTSLLGSGNIAISASPGGSTTQVQFNNAGAFGGDSGLTYAGGVLTAGYLTVNTAMNATLIRGATDGGTLEIKGRTSNNNNCYVVITGAAGSYNGGHKGGPVNIWGGPGDWTDGNGGDVFLDGGLKAASGTTNGDIYVGNTRGQLRVIQEAVFSKTLQLASFTVSTLPSASTSGAGAHAMATDLVSLVNGTTATTGGSLKGTCKSDGTLWIVLG